MEAPTTDPFSGSGGNNDHGEEDKFEAFSLSSPAAHATGSSPLPSLQSIQQHELHQMQQQQQQQQASSGAVEPQQLTFDSLPSPEELSGPIGSSSSGGLGANDKSWPPPSPANTNNNNNSSQGPNYGTANTNTNQSFLSKLLSCGGVCSVEVLRPYFDVDTADILVRMKGSLTYLMVNDGFKTEVLYSDNAMRLAYRDTDTAAGVGGEEGNNNAEGGTSTSTNNAIATTPDTASPGKGPDLYGPIWITLTLVFFVAVTSNMHLYIHHTFKKSIVDEGGIAAKEEWDYDINQLLHATWILYSFTLGLPSVLYFVLRLMGVNNVGLAELICYYGYSLVGYLPVTWICVVPHGSIQWPMLIVATILSGMLVLRNLVGPILESGGGVQGKGKGGGLIMFVVACHFVFLLVMKVVFYHAHS